MEAISKLLEVWWGWMLHSTWQVAVFAILIWGVTSLFTKTSASFRYALWLLVFVKLLVPPFLAAPWSVGTMAQHAAEAGGYGAPVFAGFTAETQASQASLLQSGAAAAPSNPTFAHRPFPFKPLLFGLWLLISVAMFAVLLVQFYRFKRLALLGSLEAPEWLRQMGEERAGLIGLGRTPGLRVTGTLSVPAVFGAWRPVVLIPGDWLESFERGALANILTHELAHIKRRDLALGWLASCLTCCYWFHPLVWVAHLQMRREREMACDDLVLRNTKTDGKEYAGTILKSAEAVDGMIPAGAGFLGLMELSENLLQRIRSAGDAARRRRMGIRSTLALIVMVIGLIPMQAITKAEPAADSAIAATPTDRAAELALYDKAHPEVQAFIKHTCESFGRSNLWRDVGALDSLTSEEREKKIIYISGVLEGEYGRQQCESLAEAGVIHDARLMPGLRKVAAYHRDDQDYDCRAKWMAVAALGRQGDESAIPVLIPLVDHGNQNTRMWARGSLVRLTGQIFDQDKAAWGAWWNAQGKEPRLSKDDLKPWHMPGTAVNSEAVSEVRAAAEILSSNPAIGAAEIDPNLSAIKVTFDQDMKGGFSWTGGGHLYPETTGKPRWLDKRTSELPVKLQEGRVYRVGINSRSFKNFCGENGIPARDRVLYFATRGANPEALAELTPPKVVSKVVGKLKDKLLVTFDKPMGGGCSWTTAGGEFPEVTDKISWSEDRLTCTLPVKLEVGKTYHIGINSVSAINFQSESGVPVEPEVWEFTLE